MLRIKNASIVFDGKAIINNCNLEIKSKQIFALVGMNGSGKSTLLRMIAGIYKCDNGEIRFNDEIIYENEEVKKEIFYVSDDIFFIPQTTISKLKKFLEVFYEIDESVYKKYLNIFRLDENKLINNFSKGMKRQVMIIFCLAIKPKLLLLDEVFDGLDPLARLEFKRSIAELLVDKEITVIISSHNLHELEDFCDSFGIISEGNLELSGDVKKAVDEIFKIQVVFNEQYSLEDFSNIEILDFKQNSKVINMVIKGNIKEIKEKLNKRNPLLLEVLPVNFEELFISEIVGKEGNKYE